MFRKVDAGDDVGAILRDQDCQVCVVAEVGGKATAVLSAGGEPEAVAGVEAHAGVQRVALILGDAEFARVGESGTGVAADEEPSVDWSITYSRLIRVADKSRNAAPVRNIEANFFAEDAGFGVGDREAYAGLQKHVVVGIVVKVAAKDVGIDAEFAEEGFGEAAFVVVGAGDRNGKPQYDGIDGIKFR